MTLADARTRAKITVITVGNDIIEDAAIQKDKADEHNTEGDARFQGKPLTRKELAQHFAKALRLTVAQTKVFIALLAEIAIEETRTTGVFVIPGIGRLVTIKGKIRLGRSPQTGERIEIKSKTLIRFRVAKKFAGRIALN